MVIFLVTLSVSDLLLIVMVRNVIDEGGGEMDAKEVFDEIAQQALKE